MLTKLSLSARPPFDFAGTVRSHGWVGLAPNSWDEERQVFRRILQLEPGKVVSLSITDAGTKRKPQIEIVVESGMRLAKHEMEQIVRAIRHMLRVDDNLRDFYRECRRRGRHWSMVAKGQGRLLRSPTVFEDVVKVICTTNTQWGGTKKMVAALVGTYGEPALNAPRHRAFPRAEAIAKVGARKFATSVRLGYRAQYVYELSEKVASGQLNLEALRDLTLPTNELKKRLLVIKGVGGYAAATLLMLLGHYDELPVDTVCRDFVSRRYFNGKPPTDAEIRATYEDWGPWKSLAYWFDLRAGRMS